MERWVEVGKSYRTRDGRKVVITSEKQGYDWPFVGRLSDGSLDTYTSNGLTGAPTARDYDEDIVAEWEEDPAPAEAPQCAVVAPEIEDKKPPREFRAGDLVRLGAYEGKLKQSGDVLQLDGTMFNTDGTMSGASIFGQLLQLIEAAPEPKLQRREWFFGIDRRTEIMCVVREPEEARSRLREPIPVREVFPDDIPAMTKAEAREWIAKGFAAIGETIDTNTMSDDALDQLDKFHTALGIKE